jgi:8-oxo-dGTP pyrophosphatase MutT (NUDIX family)
MSDKARLAFDPETMPLDPAFRDPAVRGTAIEPARLLPDALRARFRAPPTWRPEIATDGRLIEQPGPPRAAAVLIALLATDVGLEVLLTRRTAHLHDHAGQISFPGGRVDDGDRDAVHTALREAHEEIGLATESVEVLGTLPRYVTATHYEVTPVVGLVPPQAVPGWRLDAFEVDEVFHVPLAFLMDPRHHERRIVRAGGTERTFLAMPWTAQQRYFIWGATAAMLRNLYGFLRD